MPLRQHTPRSRPQVLDCRRKGNGFGASPRPRRNITRRKPSRRRPLLRLSPRGPIDRSRSYPECRRRRDSAGIETGPCQLPLRPRNRPAKMTIGRTHPIPGMNAGAATPSDGTVATARNDWIAWCTSARDDVFPINPRKSALDGLKQSDRERILLAARLVGEVPHRLEAQHRRDPFASFPAALRIYPTSH